MSFKAKIENWKSDDLCLAFHKIKNDNDAKSLGETMKGASVTELDLSFYSLDLGNRLEYVIEILRSTLITSLSLRHTHINDEGLKYLAEILPNSDIVELDLSYNDVGRKGLKHLADVLSLTKITRLTLCDTQITDEYVKYLADVITGTQVTYLDLRNNKFGIDAVQYLTKKLVDAKVKYWLDIWLPDSNRMFFRHSLRKCISVNNIEDVKITLYEKLIIEGAQYLNTFKATGIAELIFHDRALIADDMKYLAEAFKNIQFKKLFLVDLVITPHKLQFLIEVFRCSQIVELIINKVEKPGDAQLLAEFLKKVNIFVLNLSFSTFGDEGMRHLAPVLKNSDVMELNLSSNVIGVAGMKYLADILPDSKIISLNLTDNRLRNEGVRILAGSLPRSQVTSVNLDGNDIENKGCQYLINVVDDTNLAFVSISQNKIDATLANRMAVKDSVMRNTVSLAEKICCTFERLVSFDPASESFDFIVPNSCVHLDDYPFLMRTLIADNPHSKVHIFKRMCTKLCFEWDFELLNKINEFLTEMPDKFNIFFDSKLLELIQLVSDYNFVDLVKQFEDMNQCSIVKNLLFHRILFYVDETQDILYPYIYKMLHKYEMLLYKEELEPKKKEEIIFFYQSHQDISGAQEIVTLLASLPS